MATELDPIYGPSRLAGRQEESSGDWRYAGEQLGINLNAHEGLSDAGLEDLRRIRGDKMIPKNFNSMMTVRPELSEPGYSESGSYQPEVAYGQ
jgi:hypothetical protein